MSQELKHYLTNHEIASSKRTLYHSTRNAQSVRTNQTIWRTAKLFSHTYKELENCRETDLPEALHVCFLFYALHATTLERFLGFNRRSMAARALPSFFIQPGPALFRRFVRSKSDSVVEEVEFLDTNQSFSHVRFANRRELTVSTEDFAPNPVDDTKATLISDKL